MSDNYEKRAMGSAAMGGKPGAFPNFGNYAPSYTGYQSMPHLNVGAAMPNRYAQGASPNFSMADSNGIQQALQNFQGGATKLGEEDRDFMLMKAREMSKKPGFSFEKITDEEREEFARKKKKKSAAQDNSTQPRSAVGESDLTYKVDNKAAATGSEAWDSVSKYMKKADLKDPEAVKRAFAALGLEKEAMKKLFINAGQYLAKPFVQGAKVFSRHRAAGQPVAQSAMKGLRSGANVARATPVRSGLLGTAALGASGYGALKGYQGLDYLFGGGGAGAQGGYGGQGGYGAAPSFPGGAVDNYAGVEPLMASKTASELGLTPYQAGFVAQAANAGISRSELSDGVEKVAEYMGEEYAEELRDGLGKMAEALEKKAFWGAATGLGKKLYQGGKYLAGFGNEAADMGGLAGKGGVAGFANRLFDSTKGRALSQGAQKAMLNPEMGSRWAQAGRMGMGGMTGMGAVDDDSHWTTKALAGLGGAAFGRAMPRMGLNARAAGRRALMGGGLGFGLDSAAGLAGYDTGGNFRQAGTVGGFLSPLMRGQIVGKGLTQSGKGFALPNLRASGSNLGTERNVLSGLGSGIRKVEDAYFTGNPLKNKLALGLIGAETAPMVAGAGVEMVNDRIASEGNKQREQALRDVFSIPQVQQALQSGQRGQELFSTLDRIGSVADPMLQMMGMDPSQMSSLAKLALMAGGGMALGGLAGSASGNAAGGAGLGGLAGIALPMIMQAMQGQGQGQPSLGARRYAGPNNPEVMRAMQAAQARNPDNPGSYEDTMTEYDKARYG